MLSKVYVNLTDQKEPTLDFKKSEDYTEENINRASYFKKIILPTSKELENHKEYLKNNLKKNYFN